MPIYEYRCSACGRHQEVLQKHSDAPLTQCPACAKPSMVKMVTAAGFQLKGSGWYATDFKGSPKPKADQGDKEAPKQDAKPKEDAKPTEEAKPKEQAKPKEESKSQAGSGADTSPARVG